MKNKKGFALVKMLPYIMIVLAIVVIVVIASVIANNDESNIGKKPSNKPEGSGTIILESTSGKTYVGGNDLRVSITGNDYGDITCKTSNSDYANCMIEDGQLVIVPGSVKGNATITLTDNNSNKTAKYDVINLETDLSLSSTSGAITNNSARIDINGKNYGELSCTSSNTKVATCSISGTVLVVSPSSNAGEAVITLKESNGNKTVEYLVTRNSNEFSLQNMSGTTYIYGNNLTTTIKGKDYGKLSCSSSNTSIATCSISGTTLTVKPRKTAGTAMITVKEDMNNRAVVYTLVNEDITLSLSETSGTTEVGGQSLTTTISGKHYGTLSCSTSSSSVATCSISGTTLTVKPGKTAGTATITVKESKASRKVTYVLTNEGVTLSLSETSGTTSIYGGNLTANIQGKHYGTLSCTTSKSSVATCSISGTVLTIVPGKTTGTATITVKESNRNKTATYKVTNEGVTLSLSATSGKTYVGNNITVKIEGKYYGTLSCSSSNTSVALCSISGTTLTIVPKRIGNTTITVKGSNENKTVKYSVVVADKSEVIGTTVLSLSSTLGTTYINGDKLTVMIYGSNYGELSCTSSNTSVATCSISESTLIVIPGSTSGTAKITVKESINNKTVTYSVTVKSGYDCSTGTLTKDDEKGYICVRDASYQKSCLRYETVQTEPDPVCADTDFSGVTNNGTMIVGCSTEKITDAQYGCNNQYLCMITIIEEQCVEYSTADYYCPSGWSVYSGSNSTLKCYKPATGQN